MLNGRKKHAAAQSGSTVTAAPHVARAFLRNRIYRDSRQTISIDRVLVPDSWC